LENIFKDFQKLSTATQLDPTSGELKKLQAPTTVQASTAKFSAFTEMACFPGLQDADIRDLFERVARFLISRKMFPSAAQADISEFFQRWAALFQRVCEIKETDVSLEDRKKAANFIFQMMDLAARMVVKKSRPFSAFDFKGDEAAYERASQFLVTMESEQSFVDMYMSSMANHLTNLNTPPAKHFAKVIRQIASHDFQAAGRSGDQGRGRGRSRGGGGASRGGGRFHQYTPPPWQQFEGQGFYNHPEVPGPPPYKRPRFGPPDQPPPQ
jgi:uncharacterized membrane protein YgcG